MSKFQVYLEKVKNEIDFIICKNHEELQQVLDYAVLKGRTGTTNLRRIKVFPVYISLNDKSVGWTDRRDRAANYIDYETWDAKHDDPEVEKL